MDISRELREELKSLSKEVFGVSSKWQKLMEYDHVLTHKVKETVPGENGEPDTEREVEVPLYAPGTTKVKQSVRKYRTPEEVLELLKGFKAKRDEFIAQMKAQQEAAKAKAAEEAQAKKVQEELAGSALT
jgi:hypothetical protein